MMTPQPPPSRFAAASSLRQALLDQRPVRELGEQVVPGAMGVDGRLAAAEVDGHHRDERDRHQRERGVRGDDDDRTEREQEAGRPGLEDQVVEEVARQPLAEQQRRAGAGERLVADEERDGGRPAPRAGGR